MRPCEAEENDVYRVEPDGKLTIVLGHDRDYDDARVIVLTPPPEAKCIGSPSYLPMQESIFCHEYYMGKLSESLLHRLGYRTIVNKSMIRGLK